MKKFTLFPLAFGLLLTFAGRAQVQTHYWGATSRVAVTIDSQTGYAYTNGSKSPLIPTGNITVKPGAGVDVNALLEAGGGNLSVVQASRYGTFLLRPQNGQDVFAVANAIFESGKAEWSFPEFIIEIVPSQADPMYGEQYYLTNTGQNGGQPGMDINAANAWAITRGVNKINVAVIDTGVLPHEDLEEDNQPGNVSRVLLGYDPADPLNPGSPTTPNHDRGHGESVTGIIAASHNKLGVAGVAPCSNVVPINIFGLVAGTTTTKIADAINWAWDQGLADVLNNSWEYKPCGTNTAFPDIESAILNARTLGRHGKGCPVVFGSGNGTCGVSYPASLPGVIAVGALDKNGSLASYSNSGPETDVVAFGGYNDIVTIDLMGTDGYNTAKNGDYHQGFAGTSAACPQVAGALALMLSANPDLTERQLSSILSMTATDMGPIGFDNTYGSGRLNVAAALQAALPEIDGPVSTSDKSPATYSVPQQPGTTVTWQAFPANLFVNAQSTGATASFRAIPYKADLGQQCGRLTATISGPCGSVTLSKDLLIYPGATDVSGHVPPCPADGGGSTSSRTAYTATAYPNPTADMLTLPSGVTNAVLLNSQGRVVQQLGSSSQFNVQSLPAGFYNLRMEQNGKVMNQHIEVKH